MKKLLINLRYLLAPASISLALYGVVQGGVLSWLGVFMLGVAIIVDTLVKKQTVGAGFDENGETNGVAWFQNLTMYVMLPLFICLQIALAFQVSGFMAGATSLTELIGVPSPLVSFLVSVLFTVTSWHIPKVSPLLSLE
jgi:hypothetical protein